MKKYMVYLLTVALLLVAACDDESDQVGVSERTVSYNGSDLDVNVHLLSAGSKCIKGKMDVEMIILAEKMDKSQTVVVKTDKDKFEASLLGKGEKKTVVYELKKQFDTCEAIDFEVLLETKSKVYVDSNDGKSFTLDTDSGFYSEFFKKSLGI